MTVHVTPEGGGTVKVNGTTYDSFPAYITVADNSTVLSEAIPADGYEFVNWSGDLSGNENPTTDYVTCDITVTANFQASNEPPVANAGGNQTVVEGATVTLDGSASYDPDGEIVSYMWTQTGDTSVELSDSEIAQPTFTAPDTGPEGETLTFTLTVKGAGELEDSDTCTVTVRGQEQPNQAPVADAGDDQTVDEGSTVTLDGSASYDPDGTIASYQWTQTGGPTVTLSDPTATQSTFVTPPVDADGAELTFELTVTDEDGLQSTDEVSVMVSDNGINGFPTDATTFKVSTGENMGVKAGTGAHITYLEAVSPDTIDDSEGQPDTLIYGLIDLKVKVDTVGGTVEVTVYLPEAAPDDYRWYKYLPGSGWLDFSANAVFNAERDQVVLTFMDGGAGDDDGVANGVITDPSGLGTGPETSPDSDGGGGGCFISTVNP